MKLTEMNIKSTESKPMLLGFFDDTSIPMIPAEKVIVGSTGYFETIVNDQSLVGIGCIAKGLDTQGRKLFAIGTEHGNVIAFERLVSSHSDRIAYNVPTNYELMVSQICTTAGNLEPNCGLYKVIANIIMLQNADCSPMFELVKLATRYPEEQAHRPLVKRSNDNVQTEIAFPVEDGFILIEYPVGLSVLPKLGSGTTSQRARTLVTDRDAITPEEVLDLIDMYHDHIG